MLQILNILFISISVAMDAFAVSISQGIKQKSTVKLALLLGLFFGAFQALMPALGILLGNSFKGIIQSLDHWIAFFILASVGIHMFREAFSEDDQTEVKAPGILTFLLLAIATSVDSFAIGIALPFLDLPETVSILSMGLVTALFSFFGVLLGNKLGYKIGKKAEIFGGSVLIFMGFKILIEHTLLS